MRASPAAEWLGVAGRLGRPADQVEPDLAVPGHPEIFAVGDTVAIAGAGGQAGARHRARRQAGGHYVAGVIRARLAGAAPPGPFHYRHAGSLAPIGKKLR